MKQRVRVILGAAALMTLMWFMTSGGLAQAGTPISGNHTWLSSINNSHLGTAGTDTTGTQAAHVGNTYVQGQTLYRFEHTGNTGGIPNYPIYSWSAYTISAIAGGGNIGVLVANGEIKVGISSMLGSGNSFTMSGIGSSIAAGGTLHTSNSTNTLNTGTIYGTVTTSLNTSNWHLNGTHIANGALLHSDHTSTPNVGDNFFLNGSNFDAGSELRATTTNNYIAMSAGTFGGAMNIAGSSIANLYGGTVNSNATNQMNFTGGSHSVFYSGGLNYTSTAISNLSGANNYVVIGANSGGTINPLINNFDGRVYLSGSSGANNVVDILNGNLTHAGGAVHGADNGITTFNVWGGLTQQLYGGATTAGNVAIFNLLGGNVRNIQGNQIGSNTEDVTTIENVTNLTGNYQMNTLLNMHSVNMPILGGSLTIGNMNSSGQLTERSQITANTITIATGNTLTIHEDAPLATIGSLAGQTLGSGNANVINYLNVNGGVVHIDRTAIQSTNSTTTGVMAVVNAGLIKGHTDYRSSASFLDGKPNIIGNLYLGSQAIVQPYDKIASQYSTGVVFEVQNTAATDNNGLVEFNTGATLRTRMFALNSNYITTPIDGYLISASDSLRSWSTVFNGVGYGRAKYDPVFGYDYEMSSKLQYVLNQDYYYSVVNTNQQISSVTFGAEAFDRRILKSDMLGDWDFIKSSDGQSILLRFRLLAPHPVNGGLASTMTRPNSREVAGVLDFIRYPFDINDLNIRYDGDMINLYNSIFPGHYMGDFKDLLLGIQEGILHNMDMELAMRQLHAEPYASQTNVNLEVMGNFINARERAYISNLFQVEADNYNTAARQVESNDALASPVSCGVEEFVCNPLRFWATGFGMEGNQNEYKTEYGYDSKIYGGSLGAIKEFGDLYVGLSGGYANVDTDFDELNAKAKTDSYMAEALLGLRIGMGFVELHGNYGYNDQKMERNIRIGSIDPSRNTAYYSADTTADYHDNVYGGGIRLGYQYMLGDKWLLVPTLGATYMYSKAPEFEEMGSAGGVGLKFNDGDVKSREIKVPLMVRINRSVALGGFVLTPEVRGGIATTFGDRQSEVTAQFKGDPWNQTFVSVGTDKGRWLGQVGGTLELSRRGKLWAAANYDYVFRNNAHSHNYSVQFGMNF